MAFFSQPRRNRFTADIAREMMKRARALQTVGWFGIATSVGVGLLGFKNYLSAGEFAQKAQVSDFPEIANQFASLAANVQQTSIYSWFFAAGWAVASAYGILRGCKTYRQAAATLNNAGPH